jgi:hypothetical protein
LLQIGTSFQQPVWFHGCFSALLQIGTSFQQSEWFHGDFPASQFCLGLELHSSNQNGFMAVFQLYLR